MAVCQHQLNKIPAWAEKILKELKKESRSSKYMLKKHDITIKELKKDVRYTKDIIEDHERWLRKHNLVLKDKHLL